MHEDLTRWTVRLALAAYVTVIAQRIRTKSAIGVSTPVRSIPAALDSTAGERIQRWLWTLGCLLSWAHVVSAFAFYHHWSHDDAYAHTARETAAMAGIDWGGGIYFNYLFLLLWTFDVAWSWTFPAAYRARPRIYLVFLDGYLAFMVFNATVVFGRGAVRYLGIALTLCLVWLAISVQIRQKRTTPSAEGE
jgi:hypothetical protein